MKKVSILCLFLLWTTGFIMAQQAKYVFYFIGDGMGVNQVQGTELYLAELEGRIGITPICFTQFPYATVASTFSGTNGVTDSAAAGTALACGKKTKNGTLGKTKDFSSDITSVAVWAKNKGYKVGITTSVSIDHATPAAFYAHNESRKNYHHIGRDLYTTGFDFYAGSDFLKPESKEKATNDCNLYDLAQKNGYTIARGYKDYQRKSKKADKMILFQTEKASQLSRNSIPYAIDRTKNDLTLSDITRSAIHFLSKDNDKGFFLMVEGGKIDWACHSNDAATAFHEIIDMDNAIKVAYEFYSQHPDETLIVVTADHETGGLVLGTGAYKLNLQVLRNQKVSESGFTHILNGLRCKYNNQVSWDIVKRALKENFGFWEHVTLSDEQEKRLAACYEESFKNQKRLEKSEYEQNEPMAGEAKRILNEIALVGWTSGGHSAGYVPVFAIGAGAEKFQGRIDNTEIPHKIAEAAGYEIE